MIKQAIVTNNSISRNRSQMVGRLFGKKRLEDEGKMKVKFPRINRLFLHMDNAYQHFKSTGAIEFVT